MFLNLVFIFALIAVVFGEQQNLRATAPQVSATATACTGCLTTCIIIPPATASAAFPCYQGTPSDTSKCFYTDPLVLSGSTWACGICSLNGYPNYVQNDPVYTNMELWFKA